MLVSLTVGKVDAGLAILLTKDKRLIEFPSVLLPPGVSSGSIVDIQVARNNEAEEAARQAFDALQSEIYTLFGQRSPSKPILRIRNATQTSVVLEWDPIDMATATLRSLSLYRNNAKAGNIPNPTTHHSTKISGLAVDTEYSFHLILRTSAGVYTSEKVTTRTHKMTDLSGITICPGIMSPAEKEGLRMIAGRIGAKPLQDHVRIDTTHFVCTEGRGQGWERAQEMNIPIVRPEWLETCEQEGRIVGVRNFYLGADPGLRPHRSRPNIQPPAENTPAVSQGDLPERQGLSTKSAVGDRVSEPSDVPITQGTSSPELNPSDAQETEIKPQPLPKDESHRPRDAVSSNGTEETAKSKIDSDFTSVSLE